MAEYQTPEFHPAFEEYCEAIFELREDDVDVIQARIAERLMVSRPAVSEMIKRLEHEGLVAIDHTPSASPTDGQRLAERVVRRHRLAERFLTDILGLSWADAHSEAGKWEHVISEPVEEAIVRVLGNPTTCPHGNPIPGADYHAPDVRARSATSPSAAASRSAASPRSSSSPRACSSSSRRPTSSPAASGTLTAASPDGTTTVEIDGRHVGIGAFASQRILVTGCTRRAQPARSTSGSGRSCTSASRLVARVRAT